MIVTDEGALGIYLLSLHSLEIAHGWKYIYRVDAGS